MRRLIFAFFIAALSFVNGAEAQEAGAPVEKSSPPAESSTPANRADSKTERQGNVPVEIEPSENSPSEKLDEFAGRKDVLKSLTSSKPDAPFSTSVEIKLPEDLLDKGPAYHLNLCLSVSPPSKGTANLVVRKKQHTDLFLFRGDINQKNSRNPAIVRREDGWIDLRIPLRWLERETKSIVLELTGDSDLLEESFAYWATSSLQLVSHVTYEEMDPTKQTIFQLYLDQGTYPKGQLVDVATGKVLKHGIGIGWSGSKTTCLFSKDGSRVAIISKYHDKQRSGDSAYEHLWVFALRPFQQVQEARSRLFRAIQFDQDNKTLLFESDGRPKIDGP